MRHGWRIHLRMGAVLVAAVVLTGGPHPLGAQERDRPRAGEISREEMMQRVLRQYERRMARELGLNAEEMQAVQEIMAEFRPLRYQLMGERRELREQVRRERQAGLDSAEAQALLQRSRELRKREVELQEAEELRLLDVLDPGQLVRLKSLREELGEQIRRLDQRTRPRRPPPGATEDTGDPDAGGPLLPSPG